MQFIYERELTKNLIIKDDNYKYLIKVRRFCVGDEVNVTDFNKLYTYEISNITKKEVFLSFKEEKNIKQDLTPFHLGWCKIDIKNIEKLLPSLNEIGVSKITFIDCDRSQGNFKIKMDRIEKILINSNQQCGRLSMMQISFCESLDKFLKENPEAKVFDFGGEEIEGYFEVGVVGCEGGFSQRERELFKSKISFKTDLILRSETAALSVATKALL